MCPSGPHQVSRSSRLMSSSPTPAPPVLAMWRRRFLQEGRALPRPCPERAGADRRSRRRRASAPLSNSEQLISEMEGSAHLTDKVWGDLNLPGRSRFGHGCPHGLSSLIPFVSDSPCIHRPRRKSSSGLLLLKSELLGAARLNMTYKQVSCSLHRNPPTHASLSNHPLLYSVPLLGHDSQVRGGEECNDEEPYCQVEKAEGSGHPETPEEGARGDGCSRPETIRADVGAAQIKAGGGEEGAGQGVCK